MLSVFSLSDWLDVWKARRSPIVYDEPNLLTLPACVLSHFLLPFLKIKDVVQLDSALQNKQLRMYFSESVMRTNAFTPVGAKQFTWFAARNCISESLSLTRSCEIEVNTCVWQHLAAVKKFSVHHKATVSSAILMRILIECTALESLILWPHRSIGSWPVRRLLISNLNLTKIELHSDCSPFPEHVFGSLLRHCPRLEILRFGRCDRTPIIKLLHTVALFCPELRELSAFHEFYRRELFPSDEEIEYEVAVRQVLNNCSHLARLGARVFSARGILQTEDHVKLNLTHLQLEGTFGELDSAIRRFIHSSPKLEHLELSDFYDCTDDCLYAAADHLPLLNTLSIIRQGFVTDAGVAAVRDACSRICKLKFERCREMQNLCLSHGPAGVLEYLHIHDVYDIADYALVLCVQHNFRLRVLKINLFNRLGMLIQFAPDTLSNAVQYLPLLEEFSFDAFFSSQEFCNDGTLHALALYCPRLRVLNLPSGEIITAAGLAQLGSLHVLEVLCMTGCRGLNNSALCAIAKGCPKLNQINMIGCKLVSSAGIYALGKYCRRLQKLRAKRCGWIRDYALWKVIKHASDLETLDVDDVYMRSSSLKARLGRLKTVY